MSQSFSSSPLPVPGQPLSDDMVRNAKGLAGFSPANFGMVMATGIVSLAAAAQGYSVLGGLLFQVNKGLYVVLWGLMLLRLLRKPAYFFSDAVSHTRSHGYFTTVAASAVLCVQYLSQGSNTVVATLLWGLTCLLWLVLTYGIFTALTVKPVKPDLSKGLSGAWLLAVVATQSVSVSTALMADSVLQGYRLPLNVLALSTWLWGGMLYIWMMSLIFYRYTFFRFVPGDLAPPYWINMGAMAISTLAGSVLITHSAHAPQLLALLPFIKGFTFFYWAAGTWWIPMLIILSVWRHGVKRFPFQYDPLYWGAVFPLGMYSTSVGWLGTALGLDFLQPVAGVFFYVAMSAWCIVFAGLVRHVFRTLEFGRP